MSKKVEINCASGGSGKDGDSGRPGKPSEVSGMRGLATDSAIRRVYGSVMDVAQESCQSKAPASRRASTRPLKTVSEADLSFSIDLSVMSSLSLLVSAICIIFDAPPLIRLYAAFFALALFLLSLFMMRKTGRDARWER